ncbi:two pore domain potassium channel family protein [Lentibacillus cibarius]|uniref:Two pore domain potassium channel family protein n=1 Tax=Lentibacillus cibarius TaxID=2583219 RepID=A0A549YID7_9BACI|nr:potassium channel family protein [Lentibacillus cibarius]TRM11647.1 two pore domain potassium channel family protein [Lentibacillus cibarius]
MNLISWLIMSAIVIIVFVSIVTFVRSGKLSNMQESRFSAEIFYTLLVIYLIVIFGFALIYFILSMNQILLVENGELREVSVFGSLVHSIYFSGVTLLTIGYGDITPIGIGRIIALIQALIGYILPAAFVLKLVQSNHKDRDRNTDML